jgi:hypothetical protein
MRDAERSIARPCDDYATLSAASRSFGETITIRATSVHASRVFANVQSMAGRAGRAGPYQMNTVDVRTLELGGFALGFESQPVTWLARSWDERRRKLMAVQKTASAARKRRRSDKNPDRVPADTGAITDRVALRAYELFLARGSEHGHDVDDWLAAEREVRNGDQPRLVPSEVGALAVDDPARGDLRRKQYEDGAALVSEID